MKSKPARKVISFISQKGGVGKSTLACFLAVAFTKRTSYEVSLLDADKGQLSTVHWYGRRGNGGVDSENDVVERLNVSVLNTLRSIPKKEGIVIIDTPGQASLSTLEVAKLSTHIFIPISACLMTTEPQVVLVQELLKKGVPSKKIALLINNTRASTIGVENIGRYISRNIAEDICLLKTILPHQTAFENAISYGRSLSEVSHPSLKQKATSMEEEMMDFVMS